MNRRQFLQTVIGAGAIALATKYGILNAAPIALDRPAWDELPSHPSREIIIQASEASLLEWWTKYGAGHIAWQYRDVPRSRILYELNQRHIQPFEHIGR